MQKATMLTLFDLPRKNGLANKLDPEDRSIHDWYRFVLSFPPHLIREYMGRFGINSRHLVLDPFCGTGTTVVECKKNGIPAVGVEAHPMPCLASSVKVNWTPDPDGLFRHAKYVADKALQALSKDGIKDLPNADNQRKLGKLRSLPAEAHELLLTNSISALPLHKTLILLDTINTHRNDRYHHHELLALGKALVTTIGNLEFGPEVGVGPPKDDAPVIAAWLENVQVMVEDLRQVKHLASCAIKILQGDSRKVAEYLEPNSIDAVFTSPPYPNEKDYTRTTRLESVLLGFVRTKADLRALKQDLIRSNTRNVYKHDADGIWVSKHPEIQKIAKEIEKRRIELGKTSGFERLYHKVTQLYFGGMAQHLASLRYLLKPGARLGYVVGDQASYLRVMIRTGQLLASIADSLGYEVESIDLFRTRLATATREQLREEVVVLRWPGRAKGKQS